MRGCAACRPTAFGGEFIIIPFSNINALMRRIFSALSLSHSVGVGCDYVFFSRL